MGVSSQDLTKNVRILHIGVSHENIIHRAKSKVWVDIWGDLGDFATGRVGIQLQRQRQRKRGLNTIASGVRAKLSPGFFCVN